MNVSEIANQGHESARSTQELADRQDLQVWLIPPYRGLTGRRPGRFARMRAQLS